jgi:hypothetical protein
MPRKDRSVDDSFETTSSSSRLTLDTEHPTHSAALSLDMLGLSQYLSAVPAIMKTLADVLLKLPDNTMVYKAGLELIGLWGIITGQPGSTFPDGSLLKGAGAPVYLMKNGQRCHVPDPATFVKMGFSWHSLVMVPDLYLAKIPTGPDLPKLE